MKRACVLTEWTGTGELDDAYMPTILGHACLSYVNVTNGQQIPDPNIVAVEITCTDAVLTDIEADPDCAVVWSEDEVDLSLVERTFQP